MTRTLHQLAAACDLNCYFYILLFFGSAVIGFSCFGVPAQIFKLLLVYCYVLITSVCMSSVLFFSVFFRANLIKYKYKIRNNSQHCCANNFACCCVLVAVVFKRKQQLPKTRNKMQQGVQTDATCSLQQCCVRLLEA